MKTLLEVCAESLVGWDRQRPSEPILGMVNTLTTEGRFEETTEVLNTMLRSFNMPALTRFVMSRVPQKVLNNWVLKQPGLDHQIIADKWQEDDLFETIKAAALKDGALERTVNAFVIKVRELSATPQA